MALEKIRFQTNVPVEMALKFPEGKLCDSQFGDPQYMFTTTDDRVFFVAEKVAQKIHGLRLTPGEVFDACKAEVDWGKGRKGIEWQFSKVGVVPEAAVAPAASVAVTRSRQSTTAEVDTSNGSKPNGNGHSNGNGHVPTVPALPAWGQALLAQTNLLIDIYALAVFHASQAHGNLIRAEDIRSILLSSYISVSKNGGNGHA